MNLLESTNRTDAWWLESALIILGFLVGIGYLTFAALQGNFYEWGPYLSPVYSTPYVPTWWKFSPAFLLLWIPAGFRLTCYYARKAYYKSVFAHPFACAVNERERKNYVGETKLPFVLNNLHRYFLYFALALTALHWYEFFVTLFYEDSLYFGVGTLLMLIDTLALTFYVFGCHSLRHLVGGKSKSFSCENCPKKALLKYSLWKKVTFFNRVHGFWFWVSLFSICFADLYVRLLAMGILNFDVHFVL